MPIEVRWTRSCERTACAQARRWRDTLGDAAPLPVTVNLGARHFSQADLPQTIQEVLAATGLDPRDLAIELTETALIEESGVPAASLEAIRALGVEVYLDDFGTGYSSLSHLQRFPIDALKIDRAFVLHLGARDEDYAIVRAIIAMAGALGLRVVAEGVETAGQAAEVWALGCGLAQGNHFARAFSASQLEEMLSPGARSPASVAAPS